jgi:hypothetical protein
MGLFGGIGKFMARRKLDGARKGKEGPGMKKLWAALDGRKRFIVLLAVVVVQVLKAAGVGDYEGILGTVLRVLDYAPEQLPIPAGSIAVIVTGVTALGHALVKAWRKTDAAGSTISRGW